MTIKRNNLRDAICVALAIGAASMVGMGAAYAQDATPAPAPTDAAKAKQLDTITVTGSRVRRVDLETASPVVVLTRKDIEKTGKLTIGEIVNELPSIAGAPVTAAVNNGGGTGAATADVRGLGSQRTLVLIDGHRPGPTPVDLNSIPMALVERVEVLTEGSSTVYGSDAIGGVINFIMRKNYNGAEFSSTYGESGRHDSDRKGDSFTMGQSGDKGNVVFGVEYNKFDAVPAANRDFARNAYNLSYSSQYHINPSGGINQHVGNPKALGPYYHIWLTKGGALNPGGSSRNPGGKISFSNSNPLAASYGCSTVGLTKANPTLTNGKTTVGPGGSYSCFDTGGYATHFNYQPQNLILTPQERTNAFALANYNLTDDITAYLQLYHQKQTSRSEIAPLPFDANVDNVGIAANNYYNPFGQSFGRTANGGAGNEFLTRFTELGQRIVDNSTTNDVLFAGLKGSFGQTWSWDAGFDYNHSFAIANPSGYVNYAQLRLDLGPSYMNAAGQVVCGTKAGGQIAGCTPIDIFDLNNPANNTALAALAISPINTISFIEKTTEFNTSGDLFDLPAGAVKLALGADYRQEYQNDRQDPSATYVGPTGAQVCGAAQEICSSDLTGSFDVKEAYGELFVPILKNVPGAYALNLDVGTRFSKYNIFKSNDSNKIALEWRPIKDLLVRGSASDVFRAPTAANLYAGAAGGAPSFGTDPCVGLTNAGLTAAEAGQGPNAAGIVSACGPSRGTVLGPSGLSAGINPNTGKPYQINSTTISGQTTGLFQGATLSGVNLTPEKGRSYDFGLVYDPDFVPGLSLSTDYYRITLNNLIQDALDPNVVVNDCYQDGASPFCQYIHRANNGGISYIELPPFNLGTLNTSGADFSMKYRLPTFSWGQLAVSSDFTYIQKYNIDTDPSNPNLQTTHLAGIYNDGFGNFLRWRGNFSIDWSHGDWSAGYRLHWVGKGKVGDADPSQNLSADSCSYPSAGFPDPGAASGVILACPGPVIEHIPNYFDSFLTAGYNFGQVGTMNSRIDVGVDNVFDKSPPFIWSNDVVNSNTDVSTYDTVGRLFWARFTAKF